MTRKTFLFCFIILAFTVPKEIYSSSQYPLESLLYVFGVISWLISGKLTESKSVRSAYLDYDNKRLVVIEMNKSGQLLERVFQIETLAETSYTIR